MMPANSADLLIAFVTPGRATVLAHQGGWDEALLVLTPIVIFGLLLRLANRRATRLGEGEQLPQPPPTTPKGRISED